MELKVINNIEEMTLEQQQKFVGGGVEYVWLKIGAVMIVNDMQEIKPENINRQASEIYGQEVGYPYAIYGNAILVVNKDNN